MKNKILIFILFTSLLSHAQKIEIDSLKIVLIGNKLYKAHQGLRVENDKSKNTSIRYTEVDISNILFKTSRAEILSESYDGLNALYVLLKNNPNMDLKVEGHTDRIGHSKNNLKLSIRRARAIRLYLFKKGIKLNRMSANGFGDQSPICEAPCEKNQRVEFTLIENGKENKLRTSWSFKI